LFPCVHPSFASDRFLHDFSFDCFFVALGRFVNDAEEYWHVSRRRRRRRSSSSPSLIQSSFLPATVQQKLVSETPLSSSLKPFDEFLNTFFFFNPSSEPNSERQIWKPQTLEFYMVDVGNTEQKPVSCVANPCSEQNNGSKHTAGFDRHEKKVPFA
jgi:hypothetical protein